jgi:flavin reductase (DIM6/NTAB) family NADH-FMN oxidoreductase RutF
MPSPRRRRALSSLPPAQWRTDGGLFLLVGAIAWTTCRTGRILDGGDHEIVLAFIEDCSVTVIPLAHCTDRPSIG